MSIEQPSRYPDDSFPRKLGQAMIRLLWRVGQRVCPLPIALYVNHQITQDAPPPPPDLPQTPWAFSEQQRLLERSEGRLESIEGKGPGLATVSAIVAAAIAVAISLTWADATSGQQIVLIASGVYSTMSLVAPIKLVGPIARSTVTVEQLTIAAGEGTPEASLAKVCSEAAADIDRSVLRLSNLQAASRNDLIAATVLFLVWAGTTLVCSS
jgi:hypothetical protein